MLDKLNVKLTADTDDFKRGMDNAADGAEKTENAVGSLGNTLKTVKSLLVGFGVGKFFKDAESAYNTQMINEVKLQTIMQKRLGATSDEINAIKELASAQQQIGVIGDEIQLAGAQQIATFAKQKETIATLIPAMNNLIAQQYGFEASTESAVSMGNLLGKALQGQTGALTRYGISFTEAQEKIIKYGTEAERAAVLAQVITDNVGNMNEALRNTPTGELQALKNDFGDLMEQIGATFQPIISTVVPIAKQVLTDLTPAVLTVSQGIGYAGQALKLLENPAIKSITYIAAGIAMLNKLKAAMGPVGLAITLVGTALGYLIGETTESQISVADTLGAAMGSAAGAADTAADAMADLNEEVADTEKTVSRLTGFDKINKLSGSSSLGSSLINAEDVLNMENFAAAYADAANTKMPNFEVKTPDVDWAKVFSIDNIARAAQKALTGLNEGIKGIMSAFFGKDIAEAWDNHFRTLGSDLEVMTRGFFSDWSEVTDKELITVRDHLINHPVLGEINKFFMDFGGKLEEFFNAEKKFNTEADSYLSDVYNTAIQGANELMRKGMSPEEAYAEVMKNLTYSSIVEEQENPNILKDMYRQYAAKFGYEIKLEDLQANWDMLNSTGQIGSVNNASLAVGNGGASWNNGGIPSTEINFTAYFDGEEISAKTEARTANRINETNGRQ